jgi:hypothetical protein
MSLTPPLAALASLAADAAIASYSAPASSAAALPSLALQFFNQAETQAFLASSPTQLLLVFRGTEPDNLRDWYTDAEALLVRSSASPGHVHQGFHRALDAVWHPIQTALAAAQAAAPSRPLLVTGHSLGGALAVLAASRLTYPDFDLITFGQPRCGDKDFANACQARFGARYTRLVNDKDIVPRVAPFTGGYRHFGNEWIITPPAPAHLADSGVETIEDALRLAAGASLFLPSKIIAPLAPQLLTLVESLTRGKASDLNPAPSINAALDGLGLFNSNLKTFLNALKSRSSATQLLRTTALKNIDDHHMRHYKQGIA